jgi:hypothetical protein
VDPDGVRVLPSRFELCEIGDLITLIGEAPLYPLHMMIRSLIVWSAASMLDRLISHNDQIPLLPNSLTRFHSRAPPSISVRDYLARICRFVNLEPCCLLILLCYVDKVSVSARKPGTPNVLIHCLVCA